MRIDKASFLRRGKLLVVFMSLFGTLTLFNNCADSKFQKSETQDLASTQLGSIEQEVSCASPNGNVAVGSLLTGFAASSALHPALCGNQVTRTCLSSGQFDGALPVFETCAQNCKHPDTQQPASSGTLYYSYTKASGATQAECDAAKVTSTCSAVTGMFSPAPSAVSKTCLVVGQVCAYTTGAGISNPTGNLMGSTVTGYASQSATYPQLCGNQVSRTCQGSGQWTGSTPLYSACAQKCVHPATNMPVDANTNYVYYTRANGTQAECNAARMTSTCAAATGLFAPAVAATRYTACTVIVPTPTPTPTPAPTATPTPTATPVAGTRDVLKQPFASNSIWNMPIGSGAQYVPANMSASWSDPYASMPFPDEDVIVLKPTAPMVDVRESTWDGDRCRVISNRVFARVPIPANYTNPSSNHNMASGILMPDGRTIVNVQPLTRCNQGDVATSIVRWPDSDIYGDGIDGAHGGSGMSSVGGTLRVGELRPGSQGPKHALKLTVFMGEGYKCTTFASCYRWPAKTADGYALSRYGASRAGPLAFKMGALLAIPANVNIAAMGLETEPGRQIAWTMQNYGGYVVDDSYGGQFGITTEVGPDGRFISQFKADYGMDFWQRTNGGSPWMRDVQRIVRALHIVDNNGPQSIGGGGTLRQPMLPAVRP